MGWATWKTAITLSVTVLAVTGLGLEAAWAAHSPGPGTPLSAAGGIPAASTAKWPPNPAGCSGCNKTIKDALKKFCFTEGNNTTVVWDSYAVFATSDNATTTFNLNASGGTTAACKAPHFGWIEEAWNETTGKRIAEIMVINTAKGNGSISKGNFTYLNTTYFPLFHSTINETESMVYSNGNWTETQGPGSKNTTAVPPRLPRPASAETGFCADGAQNSLTDTGSSWTAYDLCLNETNTDQLEAMLLEAAAGAAGVAFLSAAICAYLGLPTVGLGCLPTFIATGIGLALTLGAGALRIIDGKGYFRGLNFGGVDEKVCLINLGWWKWDCVTIYETPEIVTPALPLL